ncbi:MULTISPECIES: PKD domain-containing protein [unclassified Flagellimonas]|uniref:PKD domain-containing protein n=1 Tax=unclassified Flagellimonas TaxID=2644544 RepID=UPI0013D768CA|nr:MULTISPECIES: PKD domain-containing protein [unclassified Flagellimonas]
MQKKIKYSVSSVIALVFLAVGFQSCYDSTFEEFVPPTGNVNNIQPNTLFTTSTDADDNLTVVFRSYSTDATSYLWDFGDGNTSSEANPNYTYATGGLFKVKLTTTSSDGLIAIDSTEVSPIAVDFDFDTIDSEVIFENLTTGASSLVWDFGDGETLDWNAEDTEEDTDFSPTYIYSSADVFEVTLTATNFLGVEVATSKIIQDLELSTVPDFTFSVSSLTVEFTDDSLLAVSHSWDFGDGNTSEEVNPTHVYAADGTYDVTLTTTNDAGVSKSITKAVPVGGIEATFAAVIQNADFETYPTAQNNNNDLVDAWTVNPDNTFNDGTDTPFDFWRNEDLEAWVSNPANNGGSGTTDKASSSGTDAQSAGGTSGRSLKFDSSGERAYQPFEVETGVEYSISAFVRTEMTPIGDLEGTFYILSDQPSADTELASLALVTQPVTSDAVDGWQQVSFNFTADATFSFPQSRVDENVNDILVSTDQKFVIFYFVPTTTVTSDNEVFLTDIVITTPGF